MNGDREIISTSHFLDSNRSVVKPKRVCNTTKSAQQKLHPLNFQRGEFPAA